MLNTIQFDKDYNSASNDPNDREGWALVNLL
jgi:hypothetical protein